MSTHAQHRQGRWALVLAALCLLSCSGGAWEGLGLSWKPPRGVRYRSEGQAPGTAEFSGGVTVRVYDFAGNADFPREAVEGRLEDIRVRVMPPEVNPVSKRTGTLPAGAVARFVWAKDGQRSIAYYLPGPTFVAVLTMTAPERDFSGLEDHFDLSLSSLKFKGQ